MKKLYVYFLAAAAIVSVASCKKKDDSTPTTAKIMFMNGSVGTTAIDGVVDNGKVPGTTGMGYLAKSGYLDVVSGSHTIGYYLTSTQTDFIKTSGTFDVSKYYSVFAGGAVNAASLVVTTDDLSAPSSGKAKVRLVNLSTDSLNESLIIGSTVASGVTYPSASSFVEITPGSFQVLAQDPAPANTGKVALLPAMTFSAGKIYTFVVTGTSRSGSTTPLTLTMINNN